MPDTGEFSRHLLGAEDKALISSLRRFAEKLIKATKGEKGIVEPTYVYLPGVSGGDAIAKETGVDYFSVPVELGVCPPIRPLSEHKANISAAEWCRKSDQHPRRSQLGREAAPRSVQGGFEGQHPERHRIRAQSATEVNLSLGIFSVVRMLHLDLVHVPLFSKSTAWHFGKTTRLTSGLC